MPRFPHSPSEKWLLVPCSRRKREDTKLTQLSAHNGIDCVLFSPQALMEFWTIALHITDVVKRA